MENIFGVTFSHHWGDPIENTLGRINSIPGNFLIATPEASLQSPSKKVAEELKIKLKGIRTKGDIEAFMGHSPFFHEMKRVFSKDRRTNFFLRMGLGLPFTAISSFAGKLARTDRYNPFSESVHLFHPSKAVAAHEIGHALDFDRAKYPGLKALGHLLPPFTLKNEWQASRNAMKLLSTHEEQQEASKILEPSFGAYVGAIGGPILEKVTKLPVAGVAFLGSVLAGHLHSNTSEKNIFYNGEAKDGDPSSLFAFHDKAKGKH